MTEAELTALAAKAYGDAPPEFSPLADDGDALRLAVALQLTVCNEQISAGVAYCTRGEQVFAEVTSGTECDGPAADYVIPDDYVATRLAITRAAAEIGRQMQGAERDKEINQ